MDDGIKLARAVIGRLQPRDLDIKAVAWAGEPTPSAAVMSSLREYVAHGRPVGDFLMAALTNDFMGAVSRADETNGKALHSLMLTLYNNVPSACHGSGQKVADWCAAHASKVED